MFQNLAGNTKQKKSGRQKDDLEMFLKKKIVEKLDLF